VLAVIQSYLKSIKNFHALSIEEEKSLFNKYHETGNPEFRNKIINANLKWVVKIAFKYNYSGIDVIELVGEGNMGLLKAFDMYDPNKWNNKFFTYATPWIRVYICNYIKNYSAMSFNEAIGGHEEELDVLDTIEKIETEKYEDKLLNDCISELSEREQAIIKKLFGFDGNEEMNMSEVAEEYGLTCERISRIKEDCIDRMRMSTLKNISENNEYI